MKPQRTLLEKITGESSPVALDWLCIYISMLTLPIEGFLSRWPQWLEWIASVGVVEFAILTSIAIVRWRKPFSPAQRGARKLSLLVCIMGTVVNVLLLLLTLGLLRIGLIR